MSAVPRTGTYREDGAVYKVEILEDKSDTESRAYKLRIVTVLEQSPLYPSPAEAGEEFDVWMKRNAGCFSGMWHLKEDDHE